MAVQWIFKCSGPHVAILLIILCNVKSLATGKSF